MPDAKQTTHVAETPNKKPATAIDKLKSQLATDYLKQVTNYYGGNRDEALRFMTASIEYVRRVPKLLECDPTSLMLALVQSAQFRFMPSSVAGEAYIIPYGNEAKFQIGYQGIATLIYRAGVESIEANVVYANDEFRYSAGLESNISHIPTKFGEKKGEPVGVYTVIQYKGVKTFKVLDKEGIMSIKNLSKAKASKESPWNSDKDPELWMWKKTCLIQHAKLLPKTEEIQKAIEADYKGEGMDKGKLDAGSPAVGAAFHAPESKDEPSAEEQEKIRQGELKGE